MTFDKIKAFNKHMNVHAYFN